MGYKLCTAEKPSVAKDIARVVGADKREDGYFIGNGYIVTWAVGHLVGLAEPEEYGYVSHSDIYNDDYRQNAFDELPLVPDKFKLIVLEETKDQFNIVKKLMHRPDVDLIIDCGDMGAEGHILQWFIRVMANCNKPVKRFCATSMTDEAIRHAMNNLRDINEFEYIIKGEFCKKKADWILGMSLSRAASIKYRGRIDIGRVQSPTLYFVVKRYLDVINFKPTNYYTFKADLQNGFSVFWKNDNNNIFPANMKDSRNRLLDKTLAENTIRNIQNSGTGTITNIVKSKKALNRPQLYDITELQRECNKHFGYSAIITLNTAQALYETHKVLTYPRTDSRYLTSDLQPYLLDRIRQIATIPSYTAVANALIADGLLIDNSIVDDSKVHDHHALIVTDKIQNFNMNDLIPTAEEKKKGVTTETLTNVLNLVIERMLVSVSQKHLYEETEVNIAFNGITFTAKGKKPIVEGWKKTLALLNRPDSNNEEADLDDIQTFPDLVKGQTVYLKSISVIPKMTTPPQLHTEATLLTAMENAGAQVVGGEILKGKGIGTQATRAAIIKSLFDKGYIKNQSLKKKNYLVPTALGINIIKILPTDLYSPQITADWENDIAAIVERKMTEQEFMSKFNKFIHEKVNEIKNADIKDVDFSAVKEEFAKCPWCGAPVYEGKSKDSAGSLNDIYYCSAKCGFIFNRRNTIYEARTQKRLTTAQLKTLFNKGQITAVCVSKANTKYDGVFTLFKNDKGYAALSFDFAKTKSNTRKK